MMDLAFSNLLNPRVHQSPKDPENKAWETKCRRLSFQKGTTLLSYVQRNGAICIPALKCCSSALISLSPLCPHHITELSRPHEGDELFCLREVFLPLKL